MQTITFITGNQKKADYLAKYLGLRIEHIKLDLDELQSLSLREIVEHKVRQAYAKIRKPVIVEDVWLSFTALGGLPWPFIKFFVENMSYEDICRLLDGKDRGAMAKCGYGYYDGDHFEYFEWSKAWTIAEHPGRDNGFWWDRIFIPEGYTTIRSELDEVDYQKVYLEIKPIEKLREFLITK
jgi:inosine triphosphate pyrophosphatase